MNTSELRLGNYAKYDNTIVCVSHIYEGSVGYNYLNKDATGISYAENISPILLTDGLLLKIGAQKGWNGNNQYYIIHGEKEDLYILYKNGIYYHANTSEEDGIYETILCFGLHSLQNKYYALNGVEMEVKL